MARPDIAIHTSGDVLDEAGDYVRRMVANTARRIGGEVAAARVRLTTYRQTRAASPALVQANLTVDGRPVRAQAAARFFREAGAVLRKQLIAHAIRLREPTALRSWPDDSPGGARPPLLALPPGQRRIQRHKRLPLARCSPGEAALTMDLMDYECTLFVDADTGQDSLVSRVGPTGYRLTRLAGLHPPAEPAGLPWTVDVHPVPRLTPEEAAERLDATDLRYRFFQDAETGRGSVLYLRYDGHYGLLTAAGPEALR
ncbi:sigma 54 modulation/S30EA ribosomal C-terminal domain-containing protein [Amycolatopsis benzoatilytica]|uniref:sigma 54 modulation/S30EA ribosomal C-terminal domain-containing protein n=1 Tax=Amycolatopsis benzoatilytica TaxID=346045 RepID=UPI000364DADD|nr:sigma 54 modulation/S30EA ribosomal C-terminal domain-containing protein [Amycolatopsis benzoatilytica]